VSIIETIALFKAILINSKIIRGVRPIPFSIATTSFANNRPLRPCQVSLHSGMCLVVSLEAGISCHCKFSGGPRRVDHRYEARR